jgi:small-conductance mechanosensitive channel
MKRLTFFSASLLLLISLAAFAAPQQRKPPETAVPNAKLESAPVVLDGKELFRIRERVLSLSPGERAKAINARISRLAQNPLIPRNPVTVLDGETSSDLSAGEMLIMVITDQDAAAEGKPRQLLAREYAGRINASLEIHREERSFRSLLLGGIYALLATTALVALLFLFRRLFPRLYAAISSWRDTRIRSIRIQSYEILTAERIAACLIFLARGLRILLVVLLLYFYIPLVFSFFPWTSGYTGTLLDYAIAPLQAIGAAVGTYLPKLIFVAVIVLVMRYVIKGVGLLFAELGKGSIRLAGFYPEWAEPTFKIVRFLLIVFTAIVVFPYLPGSESPAFKGVSIFLGVLFSLGSSSAVSNIIAGVILTYTRAFSIGDRVRINDNTGDVIEKSLLATHIRTIKNVEITIPNSLVLGSHILNYSVSSRETGLILNTSVTIGYDAPWRRVHELLIAAALATEHVVQEPRPFVLQTALNDFYVTYELNATTDTPHAMAQIYSDLHRNIQDTFNQGGVEIMSPHYAQLRDGNRTTIPGEYLAEGYQPGGIRIERTDPH